MRETDPTKALRLLLIATLLATLALNLRPAPIARAATITVNNTADTAADDGQCTLREAITAANTDTASGITAGECAAGSGDDTIDLTGVTGTINLTDSLPPITSNIVFNGLGESSLTVRRDTGGNYRIFTVGTGAVVTISGLTISNGLISSDGGGIHNEGTLTLNTSTVNSNQTYGDHCHGGGIHNEGTLTLNNSTVSGNNAGTDIYYGDGGGIHSVGGSVRLNNSTISSNSSNGGGSGGGLYLRLLDRRSP
ncbi:MAG: CSLREA domain-containing protein [Anaerolineae bacterium]|nr:CSLREA domain-containing protein [Anaerolineae bacterium]